MKTAKHKLQRCDNLKCVTYCIILIFFFELQKGNMGWRAPPRLWRAYMGYRTVQA